MDKIISRFHRHNRIYISDRIYSVNILFYKTAEMLKQPSRFVFLHHHLWGSNIRLEKPSAFVSP